MRSGDRRAVQWRAPDSTKPGSILQVQYFIFVYLQGIVQDYNGPISVFLEVFQSRYLIKKYHIWNKIFFLMFGKCKRNFFLTWEKPFVGQKKYLSQYKTQIIIIWTKHCSGQETMLIVLAPGDNVIKLSIRYKIFFLRISIFVSAIKLRILV